MSDNDVLDNCDLLLLGAAVDDVLLQSCRAGFCTFPSQGRAQAVPMLSCQHIVHLPQCGPKFTCSATRRQ